MKTLLVTLIISFPLLAFFSCQQTDASKKSVHDSTERPDYVLVIHGGAGNATTSSISTEQQAIYKASLQKALKTGEDVLSAGGSAMDAVVAAIRCMEDDSVFNAGKGAVLNHQKMAELDASLMIGEDMNAGAVAGVMHVKNPIMAAREVMLNSKHVMLANAGADQFAAERGLDTVPQGYFITSKRLQEYHRHTYGTVGAVALDKNGNLAAGTSTGGMSMKKWGRIGDSPIIGAGTWADNRTCAISATGHGEFFIRNAVAHDIHARILYKNQDLKKAAKTVIHEVLRERFDANGGIIGVDKHGNIVMEYNTNAMFRAYINSDGQTFVKIFD